MKLECSLGTYSHPQGRPEAATLRPSNEKQCSEGEHDNMQWKEGWKQPFCFLSHGRLRCEQHICDTSRVSRTKFKIDPPRQILPCKSWKDEV